MAAIAKIQPLFELLKYGQSLTTLSGSVRLCAAAGGVRAVAWDEEEWFKSFSLVACSDGIIGVFHRLEVGPESTWFDLLGACAAIIGIELFRLDFQPLCWPLRCVPCRLKVHSRTFSN